MDFWNKKDLNGPPVLTYITKQRMLNLPEFIWHFSDAVRFTSHHGFLQQEAALLSRVIYKLKCKFCKDKFLNAMQKTNKALLLYLQLDVQTLLTLYKDSIPLRYEQETYFPTIDMLDFVLVRIQGACKLLIRIRDCARTAAVYLGDKLIIGHFWNVILLCLSIVSRLAQIANEICRYFANLYDTLLKYRAHFKNAGEKWLPDNYAFPVSMQTWLDVEFDVSCTDNLQTYDLSLAESVKAYNNISIAIDSESDSDDVELVDEYFDLDDYFTGTKQAKSPESIIVLRDSDEDSDDGNKYGVLVDKFGNALNEPKVTSKRHLNKKNDTVTINQNPRTSNITDAFTLSKSKDIVPKCVTLEDILPKIFPQRYKMSKSFKRPIVSQISKTNEASNPNLSKKKAKKQKNQEKCVLLDLNSRHDFYEFLNSQQRQLTKTGSCLFPLFNLKQFINFRRQIHYLLNIGHLPKEKVYQQCRELINDNFKITEK